MRYVTDPHFQAIFIAWAILAGLSVISYIAIGWEWFIPMIWPLIFVLYLTYIVLKWRRNKMRDIATQLAANTDGKPTSSRR